MNNKFFIIGFLAVATIALTATESQAQGLRGILQNRQSSVYSGVDAEGMVMSDFQGRLSPQKTLLMAKRNHFSPHRLYTYTNQGVNAQVTHHWNQNEAMSRPWHEDYNYWRWQQPTALVVPPTAAYESSYAWGVGQVRSTPIHSQFSGAGGGASCGGVGGGMGASNSPYHPSSTRQFGVYPVRGPW